MGRVDRQTILAMVTAVAVGALGDALQILGTMVPAVGEIALYLGLFMIVVGSMLFTVGLIGVVIDVSRIVAVLLRPPLAPHQVVGPETAALKPVGGRP
jgi:hypothetical protein